MDILIAFAWGWMSLGLCYVVWMLYRSLQAKRRAGPIVLRFHSSNRNQKLVIPLFAATILIWIAARFAIGHFSANMTLLVLIWSFVQSWAVEPVFFGRHGIKASFDFIPRHEIDHVEWVESGPRRTWLLLHLQSGGEPLKIRTFGPAEIEGKRQTLERYLAETAS